MPVKVAKVAGFCWGVQRAVDLVLAERRKSDEDIFTLGPIIHNPQIVEVLQQKNVRVIHDLREAEGGKVVIRAHGTTPDGRREMRASSDGLVDTTCPEVGYAQGLIKKHVRLGYDIVIVGHEGHPEAISHMAFAQGRGHLVQIADDARKLPELGKVCVVAQTTANRQVFADCVAILQERDSEVVVQNTICSETWNRQEAAADLAKDVDIVVVVGGSNSSNTKRLAEICLAEGTPAMLIERPEEIDFNALTPHRVIGVTAGASTPNWLITRVVEVVEEFDKKRSSAPVRAFHLLMALAVQANILLSVGAAALTYSASLLQGIVPRISYFLIAGLYLYAMSILNYFNSRKVADESEVPRREFCEAHPRALLATAWLSAAGALMLAALLGWLPLVLIAMGTLLGASYNLPWRPKSVKSVLRYLRLRNIPTSKDIFSTLGWVGVAVLVPYFAAGNSSLGSLMGAGLFVFGLVFTRSALNDIKDIQGDLIVGRETIPVLIGKKATKVLLGILAIATAGGMIAAARAGWVTSLAYPLLICVAYMCGYLLLYHERILFRRQMFDLLVDANFVLAGVIALVWASI